MIHINRCDPNICCIQASILLIHLCIPLCVHAQSSTSPPHLPPIKYVLNLNNDGHYDSYYNGKEPLPPEGRIEFEKCFSSLIRFPYEAYEKDIKGVLILEVYINPSGMVTKIEVLKSLSKECDDAAKVAFSKATQYGYAPLMINGKGMCYKMEYPVLLWLE